MGATREQPLSTYTCRLRVPGGEQIPVLNFSNFCPLLGQTAKFLPFAKIHNLLMVKNFLDKKVIITIFRLPK